MRNPSRHLLIPMDPYTLAKGAERVKNALEKALALSKLADRVRVVETGTIGHHEHGVLLIIYPDGVVYGDLTPDDVPQIVQEHLQGGRVVERLVVRDIKIPPFHPQVYRAEKQVRLVLRNVGLIDPENIEDYIANEGYEAAARALTSMTPQQVLETVKESGIQGRGGAGFPTGVKWSFAAREKAPQKYIVCNADEGEPGTFKDRLILEGDPHSVLEGMLLAGYAVGATKGYVYVRGEYRMSIARMRKAIDQARSKGLLGDNILGSGFSFDVEVREGAGAYICGEETALLESMEGKRGEPRNKPPFPPQAGLWGMPTVVNNVETLANIPLIVKNGAAWYRSFGTPTCPGTKVFTLVGNVVLPGLIEVPMGITLREVIFDIGRGIPKGRNFLFAQTGGTTGGILAAGELDVPMAYDTLRQVGSGLGSGALLVVDDSNCVVDLVQNFVEFFNHESCGKCTLCREGTGRLLELLNRLTSGQAEARDIDLIRRLAVNMKRAAFCGLGQAAPTPILGALDRFEEIFREHAEAHYCRSGVCPMNAQKAA
jgi:NADH:ubiquinone oxidoreductase subunit F (NADH-binding)/(2Fe-2S) ferredoxin